jgi:transketolase
MKNIQTVPPPPWRHGLPIAVGMAAALRAKSSPALVVCLLGDAELGEGSNHEAIALAGRFGLERLTAVVIDNRSDSYGWPGGIAGRFEVEEWSSAVVDGRDPDSIVEGFETGDPDRPHVVVAEV